MTWPSAKKYCPEASSKWLPQAPRVSKPYKPLGSIIKRSYGHVKIRNGIGFGLKHYSELFSYIVFNTVCLSRCLIMPPIATENVDDIAENTSG